MGGADFFCSVSGARYFYGPQEFQDCVLEAAQENEDDEEFDVEEGDSDHIEDNHDLNHFKPSRPVADVSEAIKNGLQYSDEDVECSRDLVILCPYNMLEDGTIVVQGGFDHPRPAEFTDANIMEVFNITPGFNPDLGDYRSTDPSDPSFYTVSGCANCLLITYAAFLILKQAAPTVRPYMIYSMAMEDGYTQGMIKGVDYGPVSNIHGQFASWARIANSDMHASWSDSGKFWRNLLTQEDKSDEDILQEAWRGQGNMWVFVRPDRFPIAEALEAEALPTFPLLGQELEQVINASRTPILQPDVLLTICEFLPARSIFTLMTTCKRLRTHILTHGNTAAHRSLALNEPWYLPAGPFVLKDKKRGREEVDWWKDQCQKQGVTLSQMQEKFPWLLYRRECSKNMSMWNRRKFWNAAKQLESLAIQKGLL